MKSKFFLSCIALIGIILFFSNCSEPISSFDEALEPTEESVLKKTSTTITQAEKDGILFMREEEKLAHDVYYVLNGLFPHRVFDNIIESEQKHTDAVLRLIDFYILPDPTIGNGIGEFTNPDLQELYNTLMDKGEMGLDSSLIVGAIIEETDMIDISELLAETNVKNIIQVYTNLLDGSKNHLRAFVGALSTMGIEYIPRYLTQEEYDAIINE